MRELEFTNLATKQFAEWEIKDKKTRAKIIGLLNIIIETPFTGIGKPEALKYNLSSCWSRRINKEHRLVYQVFNDKIIIISCKYHY